MSVAAAVLLYEARRQRARCLTPTLFLFDGYNLLHGGPVSEPARARRRARELRRDDRGARRRRLRRRRRRRRARARSRCASRRTPTRCSSGSPPSTASGSGCCSSRRTRPCSRPPGARSRTSRRRRSSATSRRRERTRRAAARAHRQARRGDSQTARTTASRRVMLGPHASPVCARWSFLLISPQVQAETSTEVGASEGRAHRARESPAQKPRNQPMVVRYATARQEPSEGSTRA